jgi:hypothetical protein
LLFSFSCNGPEYAENTNYYSSGKLTNSNSISAWFDRYLDVYGIRLLAAGEVGGQNPVPDQWVRKTAQLFKLLIDKNGSGIDTNAQKNMIRILRGEIGFHQGLKSGQRIAYGGGDSYTPNPLTDQGRIQYQGLVGLENSMVLDDMIWYKNVDSPNTGDDDINEVLEHTLHTLHMTGARGAVDGSFYNLNTNSEDDDISQTTLFLAMKQAIDSNMFNPDYGNFNSTDSWPLLLKEYQYLLTFGMWEFGTEFWENGSLAPEWNDLMRTPQGILENNPLGYTLFNNYFAPIISKPQVNMLRSMFQDNDGGVSGYVPD